MELSDVGARVAMERRARKLTLAQLAAQASVGRSTLAAFEAGKLPELGFARVARICAAIGLIVDVRPPLLDAPVIAHRHLTERAGRELTKAAIADIILRGDVLAWRTLIGAARKDRTGRTAARVAEVANAIKAQDLKAAAFASLLPRVLGRRARPRRARP
jgi:transcriptional regulator with XRE-family HTH domain